MLIITFCVNSLNKIVPQVFPCVVYLLLYTGILDWTSLVRIFIISVDIGTVGNLLHGELTIVESTQLPSTLPLYKGPLEVSIQ